MVPEQTLELPVMLPAAESGGVTEIAKEVAAEPQVPVFAFTVILPEFPAVAVMLLAVDVPVHPVGKVQV